MRNVNRIRPIAAFYVIVQLSERFLSSAQVFERSQLPGKAFISKQVFEEFGRVI
jgi:hypothetical protein